MWHSLLQEKTTSEFFQLSARARVLCCKNGVVLHKTYLAICSDANKSVPKNGAFLSRKERFYTSNAPAHRLGVKLLSAVSKPLISHRATDTQIDATSTQLGKKTLKALIFAPLDNKSKMAAIAKVFNLDVYFFEGIYSKYG